MVSKHGILYLFLLCFVYNLRIIASSNELQVVKGLKLERYVGRWYEIASFPSRFVPSNGVGTRATYSLSPHGTLKVLNEVFVAGKRSFIEGFAFKANPKSDEAKFKLRLFGVPALGDYWVLFVDDDYQYALVGEPTRSSLFILARKPLVDNKIYDNLVKRAANEGYDVSKLRKTPQYDPPPPPKA